MLSRPNFGGWGSRGRIAGSWERSREALRLGLLGGGGGAFSALRTSEASKRFCSESLSGALGIGDLFNLQVTTNKSNKQPTSPVPDILQRVCALGVGVGKGEWERKPRIWRLITRPSLKPCFKKESLPIDNRWDFLTSKPRAKVVHIGLEKVPVKTLGIGMGRGAR